jgi:DNA-3-methyladenine glycosylase
MVVARELLGKRLVHTTAEGRLAGRIVETEGYVGPDDAASHARSGRLGRAGIMFGEAGFAYVYLIYGLHHCFNAVCEQDGYPGAVLVRAVEPLEAAAGERGSGPALVCRALGIDRSCNGLDLTCSPDLCVEDAPAVPDQQVRMGPRIGVDYAGAWAAHPFRLWLADDQHVSRKATAGQRYDARLVLA